MAKSQQKTTEKAPKAPGKTKQNGNSPQKTIEKPASKLKQKVTLDKYIRALIVQEFKGSNVDLSIKKNALRFLDTFTQEVTDDIVKDSMGLMKPGASLLKANTILSYIKTRLPNFEEQILSQIRSIDKVLRVAKSKKLALKGISTDEAPSKKVTKKVTKKKVVSKEPAKEKSNKKKGNNKKTKNNDDNVEVAETQNGESSPNEAENGDSPTSESKSNGEAMEEEEAF